jgi:hypothetical protein
MMDKIMFMDSTTQMQISYKGEMNYMDEISKYMYKIDHIMKFHSLEEITSMDDNEYYPYFLLYVCETTSTSTIIIIHTSQKITLEHPN